MYPDTEVCGSDQGCELEALHSYSVNLTPSAIHAVRHFHTRRDIYNFFIEAGGNCDSLAPGNVSGGAAHDKMAFAYCRVGYCDNFSDHSIAAEISKDQIATLWQSSCNPWVDYNCAAPKISPKTLRAMERSGNCDPYLDYKCLDTLSRQ